MNVILVEQRPGKEEICRYFRTLDEAVARFVDIEGRKELKSFEGSVIVAAAVLRECFEKMNEVINKAIVVAQEGVTKC